jgi:hypothetical protein
MRRLLALAAIGAAAWWLIGRREKASTTRVVIGYADGSSVMLDEGSPELDRLASIAVEATTP